MLPKVEFVKTSARTRSFDIVIERRCHLSTNQDSWNSWKQERDSQELIECNTIGWKCQVTVTFYMRSSW